MYIPANAQFNFDTNLWVDFVEQAARSQKPRNERAYICRVIYPPQVWVKSPLFWNVKLPMKSRISCKHTVLGVQTVSKCVSETLFASPASAYRSKQIRIKKSV